MAKDNVAQTPLLPYKNDQERDDNVWTSRLSDSSSFHVDDDAIGNELQHELETSRLYYTYSTEEEEKALVRRLDRRLLAFAMLGNLIKTMDNTNISNAYISGMEEDLSIEGKQYNWMTVLYMIGYLLMQIPSNMMLTRFRPSRYLPFLEIIWCILTLSMACVQSVTAIYILRLLLGAFEAGFLPGIYFLVGTWYPRKELGKRNAWITIFGSLGSALSGLIQAFLLKVADGVLGISAWRWLFLFDGTITFALAYFGYKCLPDYPSTTAWLSPKERELAALRLDREGRETKQSTAKPRQVLRSLLRNKYIYFLVVGWTTLYLGMGGAHVLGIVAKRVGYDAITANLFTSPDMLVSMLVGLGNGYLSDYLRTRLWCILPALGLSVIGFSLLAAFVQPFGLFYVAFIVMHAGLAAAAPVAMTWASEIMQETIELRAMAIAIMNTSSSSMYTWAPLVLWPVTGKPLCYLF
ncbi:major facilitator superfamily domain-containing protein [Zychaea mexicana]|uniref:major facilitator superfamily domain-containing protein n=1 Tax=Zychaea mexicana TaxID=64656 RepID=UPI0022FE8474|nr:major facilitator superfamily domain-containing protein [Zychaea mexicana]KAI9493578.1 major facilitator superfamily domain-containing protein [Zychaea mexicana]